jgi:hypothetical protein
MSEQIKEFIDRCGIYLAPDNSEVFEKELEFFAELIIKECAKVADIADENGCEWIGGNILTHFGV